MRNLKITLLFIFKILGMFQLACWLTRKRLGILCYHGFAFEDEAVFRPKLFIRPEVFEQRLKTIKRYGFSVLPLDEAVVRLYTGTLPAYPLVITVDDGFHSFKNLAVPLLKHHGYPATIYVTTYYVQHATPIFRLVVQYMFWKTQQRKINLHKLSWCDDREVDLTDPVQLEKVMWECINYGENLGDENQRSAIAEQLGTILKISYGDICRSKILTLMNSDEISTLPEADVSVELHTHRHRFSSESREEAEREIADNRAAFKLWFPDEKKHFCYPSGLWHKHQAHWLDSMKVKSSTTCIPGMNDQNTPRHALRRFLDGENIHQLEFEAALCGFTYLVDRMRSRST